jgi:hypothetical protein
MARKVRGLPSSVVVTTLFLWREQARKEVRAMSAYWSVHTLAKQLDISVRLAQKLIACGAIPSIKLPEPQRGRRVLASDALAWANSREKQEVAA